MSLQNIDPALAKALSDRGYETLTPVQLAVLEPQARGRDLLVSARTGSGKTVAYGLVLADTLIGEGGALATAGAPRVLVIAPTRELAMQVQRELQWLYAGAKVVSCVGGMDPRAERRALDQGCHIVVGTPGRLRDHLERGQLRLDHLGAAVLDEADEMLDLGFREELEEILDATPKERRTLLFSATLPRPIVALAGDLSARRPAPCRGGRRDRAQRHRLSRHQRAAQRDRSRRRQCASLLRVRRGPRLLRHARGGAEAARQPRGAGLQRRGPVRRTDPARAHPRAAGPARPAGPRLRRDRRGRARDRHPRPRPGHPRRPAVQPRGAAAPLGPHRAGGPQGRVRGRWSRTPAAAASTRC